MSITGWFKKKDPLLESDELANNAVQQETAFDNGQSSQDNSDHPSILNVEKRYDVSDCIEKIGYGRYHWKVVLTMGMMSVADSSEIWVIDLISYNLVCEWDLSTLEKALIPGLVFLFMAIGSFISGVLSDMYGRKRVMTVVYYIFTVSAIASAFAWDYYSFLTFRCAAGFCIGANYGVSICYSAEMVPLAKRGFNLLLLDLLWCAGGVYICFCAYLVMDLEGGWRILIILCAAPCLITIPLLHFCDESVRYLVITGQPSEAKKVLDRMADENKVPHIDGEIIKLSQPSATILDMFRKPFTRRTIILGICFGVCVWVFYGFMYLLPDMMAYGYCYMSDLFEVTYVDSHGCTVYTKSEYLFLLVINMLYIPGYITSPITAELWGRRPTIWYSYWGGLVVTILLLFCISDIALYVQLFLLINLYGIQISTMWLYVPECYPTYIRSTATGTHNGMSKIGAACGTFLTEYLDSYSVKYSIYTFIAVLAVASVSTLFLQIETRGKSLRDDTDYAKTPEENEINNGGMNEYGTDHTNNSLQQNIAH